MSGTFVPVDLDQVLDEFEEQELKNDATTPDVPNSFYNVPPVSGIHPSTRLLVTEPESTRTYSFNAPLDSLLQHPTDSNSNGVSLAEELADINFRIQNEDNASESGSDTSSVCAVIAAAEAITNSNTSQDDEVQVESLPENKDALLQYFDNLEVDDEPKSEYCHDNNETPENKTKSDFLENEGDVAEHPENTVSPTVSFSQDSELEDDNAKNNELPRSHETNPEETNQYAENNQEESELSNSNISRTESEEMSVQQSIDSDNLVEGESLPSTERLNENLYEDEPNVFNIEDTTAFINTSEQRLPDPNSPLEPYHTSTLSTDIMDSGRTNVVITDSAPEVITGQEIVENDHDISDEPSFVSQEPARNDRTNEPTNLQFIPEHYSGLRDGNTSPQSHGSSAESLCDTPSATEQVSADAERQESTLSTPSPAPAQMESSPNSHGFATPPVYISSGDPEMGYVPPVWVPDDVATHCMNCGLKFTLIKRKHHCRACGKVLCSSCCNMRYALPYLGNKEARVCQVCCDILLQVEQQLPANIEDETVATEPSYASTWQTTPYINEEGQPVEEENGFNPEPMAETAAEPDDADDETVEATTPPSATTTAPSSTITAPTSTITAPSSTTTPSVMAAAPSESNEDENVNTASPSDETSPLQSLSLSPQPASLDDAVTDSNTSIATPISPAPSDDSDFAFRLDIEHVRALIPKDPTALPPVLNIRHKVISIQENPDHAEIMYRLKGLGECVVFLLNKNLVVKVKIVKLTCCVKKKCWCFVTDGMGAASQEEMVVLLECEHHENTIPKDVLSHFNTAFAYAKQGHVVSDLGFTIFGQPFLGSSNNAGFLYIKPSFQCLENLPLPTVPFVVGILIQRLEAPWAQLFPLRLMLRLGTEFRYYPCPLWSVRNRPAVYGEIGHTIMNLLTDFKNFQYSVPRVTGLVIHMENTTTTVRLPQDRYDEIIKVLNAAEEHMFAFGANFSKEADSHLVCIQEGEVYKTQAINIQNKPRKVTGASFVVFTGSLKSVTPDSAKVSILEDGLMVQMVADVILELRKALREMQDFTINIGSSASNAVQSVRIEWASRETNTETHISPIDGSVLTDTPTIRVHSSCDFTRREIYRIRWTHVFLKRSVEGSSRGVSSRGLSHLTGELARACCEALRSHLQGLYEVNLTCLALRVNIDADSAEYAIGANQKPLPAEIMVDLDNALVPTMNAAAVRYQGSSLTVELFFNIVVLF